MASKWEHSRLGNKHMAADLLLNILPFPFHQRNNTSWQLPAVFRNYQKLKWQVSTASQHFCGKVTSRWGSIHCSLPTMSQKLCVSGNSALRHSKAMAGAWIPDLPGCGIPESFFVSPPLHHLERTKVPDMTGLLWTLRVKHGKGGIYRSLRESTPQQSVQKTAHWPLQRLLLAPVGGSWQSWASAMTTAGKTFQICLHRGGQGAGGDIRMHFKNHLISTEDPTVQKGCYYPLTVR